MQTKWKTFSKQWCRRFGWGPAALAMVAVAMSGCQSTYSSEGKPVAVGMPARVTNKVDDAKSALVDATTTLATRYDQTVCNQQNKMAQASDQRQAMAEANLDVAEAVVAARSQAGTPRGGGPADEHKGIIMIEEPSQPKHDYGQWQCEHTDKQPACAGAAGSAVAHKIYRTQVDGYDLNPVTVGDVLEAYAADMQWADQYLIGADTRAQADKQIEQGCRSGHSPLARFFKAADSVHNGDVRADLLRLRHDFVGQNADVCAALPVYYGNVMSELQSQVSRRMRTGQCTAAQWNPVWDD